MRKLLPLLIFLVVRALACTLRFRVEDRCGLRDRAIPPLIWTFWHNRLLAIPFARLLFVPHRNGTALTSPSKDGAILAGVMRWFGINSARGSSSRRGGVALRELMAALASGADVAITPDGPRGPLYQAAPGAVRLAQATGNAILPIHVHYSRYWELKSWDRFRIPKPFARVEIIFDTLHPVPAMPEGDEAAFEAERARLERTLAGEGKAGAS